MVKPKIEYFPNGNIKCEHYRLNDNLHNPDGPAVIFYYENGRKEAERFYINNQLHNENGPAFIQYYENGNKKHEYYYLNGKCLIDINSIEELQRYIKLYNIS